MRVDEAETVELEQPDGTRAGGRFARGLAGAVAAGLAVLAAALVAAGVLAMNNGERGPGGLMIIAHVLAALLALGAAAVADRIRGLFAAVAITGVLVITAAVLWAFWLA